MIQKPDVVPTNPIDMTCKEGIMAAYISGKRHVSKMANVMIIGLWSSHIEPREALDNEQLLAWESWMKQEG